jgi:hypothetical protein
MPYKIISDTNKTWLKKPRSLTKARIEKVRGKEAREIFMEKPGRKNFSIQERLFLLDSGIVGNRNATKPLQVIPYSGHPEMVGFNPIYDGKALLTMVKQDDYGVETDIPLYSGGFSFCHAILIYERTSCKAMLLHVADHSMSQAQLLAVDRVFYKKSQKEAIFIYGTESRLTYDEDERFLKKRNTSFRSIQVSTNLQHWGILYDPESNHIMVNRGLTNDVVAFDGISKKIHDPNLRAKSYKQKRKVQILREAFKTMMKKHPDFYPLSGKLSGSDLAYVNREINTMTGIQLSSTELFRFLVDEHLIFVSTNKDKTMSISAPHGFRYDNEDEDDLSKTTQRQHELEFSRRSSSEALYFELLCKLTGYVKKANRSIATLEDGGSTVIVVSEPNKIKFLSQQKNPFLKQVIRVAHQSLENPEIKPHFQQERSDSLKKYDFDTERWAIESLYTEHKFEEANQRLERAIQHENQSKETEELA